MSDPAVDLGLWGLLVAVLAGAVRVGTPYLFVSLGECITEKSGRVNLGLEGTLVMGAMSGYGVSYLTSQTAGRMGAPWLIMLAPWMGVLAAGMVGSLMGAMHAVICNRQRVNAVAVGIAMMIFGAGLSSYLGKPLIQPSAPRLPSIDFGAWSSMEQVRTALSINVLFLMGLALTPLLAWMMKNTRWGLILRLAGESEEAAAAMGYSVPRIRILATAAGGVLAGIGGSYLSLYYPGSWKDDLSSGQGLMAVALVIFARWDPIRCLLASLLIGGVSSLGLALQGQTENLNRMYNHLITTYPENWRGGLGKFLMDLNLTSAAMSYLWNSAPYVLTLVIMILTSSRARAMIGSPAELSRVR